jgi:hypothetical protein
MPDLRPSVLKTAQLAATQVALVAARLAEIAAKTTFFNSSVADTPVSVAAAPGAGKRLVVDGFVATSALAFNCELRQAGTAFLVISQVAATGGTQSNGGPFYLPENTALSVVRTSGASTVAVTVTHHVETL